MDLLRSVAAIKPSTRGALLMVARAMLIEAGKTAPDLDEILSITGGGRSQVYARMPPLVAAIEAIDAPPPATPPPSDDAASRILAVATATIDLLMREPGAAARKASRTFYTAAFRRFVLGAMEPTGVAHGLTLAQCAIGFDVPTDTLHDWLRPSSRAANDGVDQQHADAPATESAPPSPPPTVIVSDAHLATVLYEWSLWRGAFTAFCAHVRDNHHVPYGATFIATVLRLTGLRKPTRRKKPPTPWSRSTFERHFPGAKWVGDGKQVDLVLNGQSFRFNLEAMVDGAVGAPVGVHVSDAEDGAAVIDAFDHAKVTTGDGPIGVQLDHRPSNWTDDVQDAIAPAEIVPSTPGRGQSKPSVEGAFGLFSQTAPPLVVGGDSPRQLARSILSLVATLWAWCACTKPRHALGGKSPAEVYHAARPTAEDVERAREHLLDLRRRYELTQESRLARADPVRIAILERAFDDLGLADPNRHFAATFARYATNAIIEGIAVFNAKNLRGTLPPDVNIRYLGGIIRNVDLRDELLGVSDHLLTLRVRARDLTLAPLRQHLDGLRRRTSPRDRPAAIVALALDAEPDIDHRFWSLAAAADLRLLDEPERLASYRHCSRIIATHFEGDEHRRRALLALLAGAAAIQDRAA